MAVGKASSRQVNPSAMELVPGSQARLKTKIADNTTALANSGTEVVRILTSEMSRSYTEPARMAASTPSVKESGIIAANVATPSSAVGDGRGHRTAWTGGWKRGEKPTSAV